MIDRALNSLFKAVAEEAQLNPSFARKLEDSLAKFAEDYVERQRTERRVGEFHPFIEYRKSPDDFAERLSSFDQGDLRLIVAKHNLDAAGLLKSKTSKKALVEHIVAAARKRVERDAKLFEY